MITTKLEIEWALNVKHCTLDLVIALEYHDDYINVMTVWVQSDRRGLVESKRVARWIELNKYAFLESKVAEDRVVIRRLAA